MDWDEALLTPRGVRPQEPASYYRARAARARRMAEAVTTPVLRARLLEEADQYDSTAARVDAAATAAGS